jgi:hypothetical protein
VAVASQSRFIELEIGTATECLIEVTVIGSVVTDAIRGLATERVGVVDITNLAHRADGHCAHAARPVLIASHQISFPGYRIPHSTHGHLFVLSIAASTLLQVLPQPRQRRLHFSFLAAASRLPRPSPALSPPQKLGQDYRSDLDLIFANRMDHR